MKLVIVLAVILVSVAGEQAACAAAAAETARPDWWLTPFWEGTVTHGESLFFIESSGERPTAGLLFHTSKIVRVEQPSTGLVLVEGKDYALGANGQSVILPEGSRIPFKKLDEMYPEIGAPQSIKQRVDGKKSLFFSEGHVYHDLQVEVTYEQQTVAGHDGQA
ncbi:MAG: hypothetical protein HZB26_20080 [Candidatus Hydrogenedentes bacterium]|nr:hypothetical protein [Candidatus Hydrogenedentota bacterium]